MEPSVPATRLAEHGQKLGAGYRRLSQRRIACHLPLHWPRFRRGPFISSGKSPRFAWATSSVASRVRSCRTGCGAGPAASPCSYPLPQAARPPDGSRVKATPGILTRSLRSASGCGFRSRPCPLFQPNNVRSGALKRMAGQGVGAARSPAGRGHGPLTRQERATLCPGDRSSGPAARNPCPRGSRRRGWRVQRGKASLETTMQANTGDP